jgi:Na+/proline symporter
LDRGEIVLNKRAKDELMPRFISRKLSMGVAGLILAALLAASMSSMDSGLNSICTLLVTDFHRRLGWGRSWLAKRLGKPVDELDESDELRLGRPLVLIIGVAATLFSLLVGQLGSIWGIMIGVINTVGVPLLCVFLLGILTRRTTAAGALFALVSGTLFTAWLAAPSILPAFSWMWPFDIKLSNNWPVVFGAVFTLSVGYLASFVMGRGKTERELRGLVYGIGKLGDRSKEVKRSLKISISDEMR